MGLLDGLLGGGGTDRLQDFAARYTTGEPTEGYTHEEALEAHDQVAGQLTQNEYTKNAEQVAAQMSPDQRQQLAQQLVQHGTQQGIDFGSMGGALQGLTGGGGTPGSIGPGILAQLMGHAHQQSPGGLGGLLGSGGMLSNPIAKMALGGIAAMALKQATGGRSSLL